MALLGQSVRQPGGVLVRGRGCRRRAAVAGTAHCRRLHGQPDSGFASSTQRPLLDRAGDGMCIRCGWNRGRSRSRSLRSCAMGVDPAAVDTGAMGFICNDPDGIDGVSAAALAAFHSVRAAAGTPRLRFCITRVRGSAVLSSCMAWIADAGRNLGSSAITIGSSSAPSAPTAKTDVALTLIDQSHHPLLRAASRSRNFLSFS